MCDLRWNRALERHSVGSFSAIGVHLIRLLHVWTERLSPRRTFGCSVLAPKVKAKARAGLELSCQRILGEPPTAARDPTALGIVASITASGLAEMMLVYQFCVVALGLLF